MKPVNIYSLLQAKLSLNDDSFNSYLKHHSIDIKKAEIKDLAALANALQGAGSRVRDFNGFYVGYKIPQIGKEFDLLRFGRSAIINIELKSNCEPEKIQAQLLRNKYYLSFTGKAVYEFTFVSSSGEIYTLADSGQLEKINSNQLLEIITKSEPDKNEAPDSLFNPSDYLVSPFNSTSKFLAGEFFLTHQQEEFKGQILKSITSTAGPNFISITGSAGTGKTLLTFDIARHLYTTKKNALIIHCGQLNEGHHTLAKHGWIICPIKTYKSYNLALFDVIIIDEAQRIYQHQLEDLVARVNIAKCACIFSYDKIQTLANWEEKNDTAGKIDAINSISRYKLSEKIRTNKEIASFIKLLFNNKRPIQPQKSENILISYFNNVEDAKSHLNSLDTFEWEVLRFTPSQYKNEHHEKYHDTWRKTSHQVIGQEFEGVAIAVDKFFAYDDAGDLIYRGEAYYAPTKMLFQNITRARKRLNLVIIENQEVLNRCLSILTG
ncbi:DNA/RNA helicase domain-containing protein [Pseudomonas aeruginosa]|uniref:DNA/RNA helicase domain-containing protein n=1 Tax=Pseudomonas aeruginosa TaxID=287 RepID=UPI00383AB8F4